MNEQEYQQLENIWCYLLGCFLGIALGATIILGI